MRLPRRETDFAGAGFANAAEPQEERVNTYRMDDGTVVKIENTTAQWHDKETGTPWHHETLYRSRRNRYWIEHSFELEGRKQYAEWVSHRVAAQWLLANRHNLPEDLAELESEVSE
jgi:hypothetical protein